MSPFMMAGIYSACITFVGTASFLLALSHIGTGFGFGEVKKDLIKIVCMSVLVGVAENAWLLAQMPPRGFHLVVILVHSLLLKMFFFENLSAKEAFIVSAATRILYFIVALFLMVILYSNA